MTLDTQSLMIIITVIIINLIAFTMMLMDKARSARVDSPRLSEGLLFFMAAAFGALGVYLGMFAVRHKTRKWYFLVGIPLMMIENLATVYLLLASFN